MNTAIDLFLQHLGLLLAFAIGGLVAIKFSDALERRRNRRDVYRALRRVRGKD